ncbi:MAG: hypothetical protein IT529_23250 [Burkholderiales bacterium]|nr:hypothetical protein [Burkholderiales bacterium]
MHDAVSVEDLHRPAVVLANEGFVTDGRSAASNVGMPGVRIVAETIPCECTIAEVAEAGIRLAMDDIIGALVRPLTQQEAAPERTRKETPSRIVFKGHFDEVNRFFYKRGWGDGLPLVPPTEAAVREMLAGTDLPPDHLVGRIEPRYGFATVETIAVNAVMAGALPIHLPILIACVEALVDPAGKFSVYVTSTGSWAPFCIVSGPVRRDARVNGGSGALSPGDIANAAIGRAIGLLVKNIGGARKAVEDMGVLGNPGKYSSVIAENEEASPWQPLHVDQGFDKDESAVTLFYPNSYTQLMQYGTDEQGILSTLVYNLLPGRCGLTCFLLTPAQAKTLAAKGWTKALIARYAYEFGRVPAYKHRAHHGLIFSREPGTLPPHPMDPMAVLPGPEDVRVVVAGGPGAFAGIVSGGGLPGSHYVSKKIRLPAGWGKLVARYGNVVPKYETY